MSNSLSGGQASQRPLGSEIDAGGTQKCVRKPKLDIVRKTQEQKLDGPEAKSMS